MDVTGTFGELMGGLERLDLGDHVGFLLEPIAARRQPGESYFTFDQAKNLESGHPA